MNSSKEREDMNLINGEAIQSMSELPTASIDFKKGTIHELENS